jgi:hypothetical protein
VQDDSVVWPPAHLKALHCGTNYIDVFALFKNAARKDKDGIVRIDREHAMIAAFVSEH